MPNRIQIGINTIFSTTNKETKAVSKNHLQQQKSHSLLNNKMSTTLKKKINADQYETMVVAEKEITSNTLKTVETGIDPQSQIFLNPEYDDSEHHFQ